MSAHPASEREYTAHTRDETVWVRVGGLGQVLGVQLEPPVMARPGRDIAARIQACADVAYFEGQLDLRADYEREGSPPETMSWMGTRADYDRARQRLQGL